MLSLCRFRKNTSGCSAVRLAHLLWEQGVVGSNPATPTKGKGIETQCVSAFNAFLYEINTVTRAGRSRRSRKEAECDNRPIRQLAFGQPYKSDTNDDARQFP